MHRRVRTLVVLALLTVAAIGVPSSPAIAAPRSAAASGGDAHAAQLVFVRARCTDSGCRGWRIVTASARDQDEHVVAGPFPTKAFDDHFVVNWSPDGRWLTFMAYQAIWIMDANGRHRHRVFTPPAGTGVDDGPAFTADGRRIVFTRCCPSGYGYSLWSIRTGGTGLRNVTREAPKGDGPADTTPQVSPNGRWIAFNRCFPTGGCAVAKVTIDGAHRRELTPRRLDSEFPHWSPDGRHLVFTYHGPGGTSNIATIRADGTHLRRITHSRHGQFFDASYAPGGHRLIYSHYPSLGSVDLFTMRLDGTHRHALTHTPRVIEVAAQYRPRG
jgi:Tol biopolymer transport system component